MTALLLAAMGGCVHKPAWLGGHETAPAGLDRDGSEACGLFADGRKQAVNDRDRLRLADNVHRAAGRSDTEAVADGAVQLGRSADKGTEAWNTAASAFSRACTQAGWRPRKPK